MRRLSERANMVNAEPLKCAGCAPMLGGGAPAPVGAAEETECGIMTSREYKQRDRDEFGPIQHLFASAEQLSQGAAPLMARAARTNLECASLVGRRARAYLDVPKTLANCRGPQDLFAAQVHFWQTAARDYAECSQRILGVLSGADADDEATNGRSEAARQRDTLTFPEVFNFVGWTLPDRERDGRRSQDKAA